MNEFSRPTIPVRCILVYRSRVKGFRVDMMTRDSEPMVIGESPVYPCIDPEGIDINKIRDHITTVTNLLKLL
jgi:hypothetical protein